MRDNLFDNKITSLDVVKVALLIVTLFSTWRIMDLITPDDIFAFVRIGAAVVVVEGSFIAFERATRNAKTALQSTLATVGFFCSLAVIVLYLALTGFLEFGGPALLSTLVGHWAGIEWTVNEVVMCFALAVTAAWIGALASIARLFALADPDKQAELIKNQIDGDVKTEGNKALARALKAATPEIVIRRALLKIDQDYGHEFSPVELAATKANVEAQLREFYQTKAPASPPPSVPLPVSAPLPVVRPVHIMQAPPQPVVSGNGNGHNHPTP